MRVIGPVAFVLLSLFNLEARAAFIVVQDDRYVSHPEFGTLRPAPGASLFHGTVSGLNGGTTQDSALLPGKFTGVADMSIDGGGGIGGINVFDVQFVVDVLTTYTLSGSIDATQNAGTAFLSDSTGGLHTFAHSLSLAGFFEPGTTYRLFVAIQPAAGNMQTAGAYNFRLVPEPSVLLLVLCGLMALRETRFQ